MLTVARKPEAVPEYVVQWWGAFHRTIPPPVRTLEDNRGLNNLPTPVNQTVVEALVRPLSRRELGEVTGLSRRQVTQGLYRLMLAKRVQRQGARPVRYVRVAP